MKELVETFSIVVGTMGGAEIVKYLFNRRSNNRKAEADADSKEFAVLEKTTIFLQEQLLKKEERFAEQTDLVRQLNKENLELQKRVTLLEAERALKLCERRKCAERQPQSGY